MISPDDLAKHIVEHEIIGVSGGSTPVSDNVKTGSFGITVENPNLPLTTGYKGHVTIPYDGTIVSWQLLADQDGSVVVDVWKSSFEDGLPTLADTITGSQKPTLTNESLAKSTTISEWNVSVTSGDIIGFNIDSVSTVRRINLVVKVVKE